MKKILLAFTCFIILQSGSIAQALENPKGEIRLNFLNTILMGSVEIGYETFFKSDQSLGIELHLNDRFGYSGQKDGRNFETTSILASYNFYFAGDENGKMYISPFLKYRFGNFTEVINNATAVTNMNSGAIGLLGGYRWNFNNFAFGPFGSINRQFSQVVQNRFSAVELNAGFNVGYRF
ncbi:DUF3575 domain-containing protein [Aquiflexum sp. TKW24L]|uniref:DUF3575 domain-containing protein n=1 Tax=Aquiflexum sp. TKW24L TaxID=2942212 RepID=UPI0020BF6D82|nr:DUF3575 domain-containing protein [Aquiflexum sp. TKW24L]MCL6261280.1 DUF3575 domain-containing protein [Aquiflexum sp. TKW24L]